MGFHRYSVGYSGSGAVDRFLHGLSSAGTASLCLFREQVMLTWPWRLKERGILGMNRRNVGYISRYNSRRLYPLVDNKLKTKMLAQQAGIASPALIGAISSQHDVNRLGDILSGVQGFAIKPAKGSGSHLSLADLQRHTSNILAGLYSLGGTPDVALIEELIEFDQQLSEYSFEKRIQKDRRT